MGVYMKENGQLKKGAGLYKISVPVGLADIYSTEEKEIGLWIDNKPLYQKILHFQNVTLNSGRNIVATTSQLSSLSIDKVVGEVSGNLTFNNNANIIDIPYAVGATSFITAYYDSGYGICMQRGGSALATNDIYLTIQYTKTTDTPWSGKFVPQGYGYVSSGDIYSFEERQVGVWTDGKPLYQKTIDLGSVSSSSSQTVDLTSLNIETIADIKGQGVSVISGNNYVIPLPFAHTQNITDQAFIRYNANKTIGVYTASNVTLSSCYVTIQYTKTTDVAGSGEYVPSGDKAKHYTADEHIVGTWTDGSTLYEKTVRVAANATGAITLWTDASVIVKDYDGRFVFRSSENSLSLYSRLSDTVYRAELSGIGNNTSHGVYADITLGTSRTNTLDIELTVRYIKASS